MATAESDTLLVQVRLTRDEAKVLSDYSGQPASAQGMEKLNATMLQKLVRMARAYRQKPDLTRAEVERIISY